MLYYSSTAEKHGIYVAPGDNSTHTLTKLSDAVMGVDAWHLFGVSIDEATGAGGGFLFKDGDYDQVGSADTFDATYTSPSASNATYTLEIGATEQGNRKLASGSRVAGVMVWEGGIITKANMVTLWNAQKDRFGL